MGLIPNTDHDSPRATLQLVAFFAVGGIGAYTLFVSRMMGSFEVTQVVSDRVRDSLDALAEGLIVMDEHENVLMANEAFCEMVGRTEEFLIGRKVTSLGWIVDHTTSRRGFPWIRAETNRSRQTDQIMQYQHPNGSRRFLSINASPTINSHRSAAGVIATFRDVTATEEYRSDLQKRLVMLRSARDEISIENRELQRLATEDTLTECLNRRALQERMASIVDANRNFGCRVACLMIDNDHFKRVNDDYGHHVGDLVLQRVACTLRQCCPTPNWVCRYGGEEFCVIMPDATVEQACETGECIRATIESLRFSEPSQLRLSVSVGVSHTDFGAKSPENLIIEADQNLYAAKNGGRNQVVMHQTEHR